jgi:hypothetical protein
LFFMMLPALIHSFGKMKGALVNYVFSWISMFVIIITLSYLQIEQILYKSSMV